MIDKPWWRDPWQWFDRLLAIAISIAIGYFWGRHG